MRKSSIVLSSSQHSTAGRVLSIILYGGFHRKTLKEEQFSGCPHDGGIHKLVLHGVSQKEAHVFLDSCEKTIREKCGSVRFMKYADGFAELRKKIISA